MHQGRIKLFVNEWVFGVKKCIDKLDKLKARVVAKGFLHLLVLVYWLGYSIHTRQTICYMFIMIS